MSSDDGIAIRVADVAKCYPLYERPEHRLRQAVMPRLQRMVGAPVKRYYRESWALRGVSFDVARGETVGIIGRNGSGKSTLLQTICGTLAPTCGDVRVGGRIGALLELGSGFNPEFTGRENVYMNAAILGMTPAEVDAKYASIVEFADIGDFIDQPVKTYSSGMYVRLAFAVIAHADADILVVDEALSVGDVFFAQKCMRFLRDFQRHGTVLFVSHDASAVVNLCDRAIWLDKGRVQADGPAKAVCEAYHASVYGQAVRPIAPAVATSTSPELPASVPTDESRLSVIRFDPTASAFGDGGARILSVAFEDGAGRAMTQFEGGETVRLKVVASAVRDFRSPIVGYFIKDRLGQQILGRHTYMDAPPPPARAGDIIEAAFEFQMPCLPQGRYTVDVAVADGDHHDHVQAVWMYDVLVFDSAPSTVTIGLVGLPYRAITLDVRAADAAPIS